MRQKPLQLEGTRQNQTEPSEIRRNPPKLDGILQN